MTIQLITEDLYNELLQIQKDFPKLTFQNNGYEYINKSTFTDEDVVAFERVSEILNDHIQGFNRFDNFRLTEKTKEIQIRIQYYWDISFRGVGYLLLDELLNGFREH